MRISPSILGTEVLAIDTGAAEVYDEPGDCTSYPVGFTAANEIPDMAGPYREGWE